MSIAITDLILLLAAAQGLFLTALIFHKHGGLFANRFLGILILLYSLLLLHLLFEELGYAKNFPHLPLIAIGVGFLVPPLHYLYAKFLARGAEQFSKTDWLHFLAFLIYEGYRLFQFFLSPEELPVILNKAKNEGLPIESIVFNWTLLLLGFAYMYLTIRILNRFARYLKEVFSTIDKIKLA